MGQNIPLTQNIRDEGVICTKHPEVVHIIILKYLEYLLLVNTIPIKKNTFPLNKLLVLKFKSTL